MNIIGVKNEKSEMDKRRIFISFTFVICLTIFVGEYFKVILFTFKLLYRQW